MPAKPPTDTGLHRHTNASGIVTKIPSRKQYRQRASDQTTGFVPITENFMHRIASDHTWSRRRCSCSYGRCRFSRSISECTLVHTAQIPLFQQSDVTCSEFIPYIHMWYHLTLQLQLASAAHDVSLLLRNQPREIGPETGKKQQRHGK